MKYLGHYVWMLKSVRFLILIVEFSIVPFHWFHISFSSLFHRTNISRLDSIITKFIHKRKTTYLPSDFILQKKTRYSYSMYTTMDSIESMTTFFFVEATINYQNVIINSAMFIPIYNSKSKIPIKFNWHVLIRMVL